MTTQMSSLPVVKGFFIDLGRYKPVFFPEIANNVFIEISELTHHSECIEIVVVQLRILGAPFLPRIKQNISRRELAAVGIGTRWTIATDLQLANAFSHTVSHPALQHRVFVEHVLSRNMKPVAVSNAVANINFTMTGGNQNGRQQEDDTDHSIIIRHESAGYTKTSGGEPLWTLVADSAAHSMEDSITRIKDVRMVFYDQEAGDILLTAEYGELMPEYRTVTVSNNVKVTNPQGDTLQTDYLEYKEAGNILQTDRMVTIHIGQFMVMGKGMQVDVETRTLVLLNDVKAQFDGIDSH